MGLQGGAERDLRPSRSAGGLESRRCQRQHPRCAARAAVGAASHARGRARGTLPARRGGRAGEGAATAAAESSTVAAAMRPVRSCEYLLKVPDLGFLLFLVRRAARRRSLPESA